MRADPTKPFVRQLLVICAEPGDYETTDLRTEYIDAKDWGKRPWKVLAQTMRVWTLHPDETCMIPVDVLVPWSAAEELHRIRLEKQEASCRSKTSSTDPRSSP